MRTSEGQTVLEDLEMKPREARLRWFKLEYLGRRTVRFADGRQEVWRRSREGGSWMRVQEDVKFSWRERRRMQEVGVQHLVLSGGQKANIVTVCFWFFFLAFLLLELGPRMSTAPAESRVFSSRA